MCYRCGHYAAIYSPIALIHPYVACTYMHVPTQLHAHAWMYIHILCEMAYYYCVCACMKTIRLYVNCLENVQQSLSIMLSQQVQNSIMKPSHNDGTINVDHYKSHGWLIPVYSLISHQKSLQINILYIYITQIFYKENCDVFDGFQLDSQSLTCQTF